LERGEALTPREVERFEVPAREAEDRGDGMKDLARRLASLEAAQRIERAPFFVWTEQGETEATALACGRPRGARLIVLRWAREGEPGAEVVESDSIGVNIQ
jgi:hypothetical protein